MGTTRFQTYPAYKDSGVEWLGEIPNEWGVAPMKHVTDLVNGLAFKPDEWGDEGVPIIRIENLNGGGDFNFTKRIVSTLYHVEAQDLLFGWSGNRGTSFGPFVWTRPGLHYLNQHIFKLTHFDCHRGWLYWALKGVTEYVEQQAHGIIGMVHVTRSDLGIVPIPVISESEQQAIALFLDRATQEIDALVAKKERLIELLQEKRAALITRAVTKGLPSMGSAGSPQAGSGQATATVPMKDSGVEWLGQIPAHWTISPARRFLRSVEQGWSPVAEDRVAMVEEWAVLKLSAVAKGKFRPEEHKVLPESVPPEGRYQVNPGDFLLTRANTPELVGDVCVVQVTRPRLMLSDLVYRIRFDLKQVDLSFLCYWFLSNLGRYQIVRDSRGSSQSMVKVSGQHIRSWLAPLPPPEEQRAITRFLDRETAKLDSLIDKVREGIDRLKEYRTALISAVVTGKIDVREECVRRGPSPVVIPSVET